MQIRTLTERGRRGGTDFAVLIAVTNMGGGSRSPVVVVTGASAGIGRAVGGAYGARGASIGLMARGRDGLEAARREVEAAGGRGLVLPTSATCTERWPHFTGCSLAHRGIPRQSA